MKNKRDDGDDVAASAVVAIVQNRRGGEEGEEGGIRRQGEHNEGCPIAAAEGQKWCAIFRLNTSFADLNSSARLPRRLQQQQPIKSAGIGRIILYYGCCYTR